MSKGFGVSAGKLAIESLLSIVNRKRYNSFSHWDRIHWRGGWNKKTLTAICILQSLNKGTCLVSRVLVGAVPTVQKNASCRAPRRSPLAGQAASRRGYPKSL